MAPKKIRKPVQETMVEEPTQYLDVPSKAIREEEQKDSKKQKDCDNCDDRENEEEQPTIVLFIPEQLKALLKMNRLDFSNLVEFLKGRSSKSVRFKATKPGNFDEVRDQKVMNVWLAKMEDYFHATKVRQHLAVEFA